MTKYWFIDRQKVFKDKTNNLPDGLNAQGDFSEKTNNIKSHNLNSNFITKHDI